MPETTRNGLKWIKRSIVLMGVGMPASVLSKKRSDISRVILRIWII